jgi:hypothetical protein
MTLGVTLDRDEVTRLRDYLTFVLALGDLTTWER